MLYRPLGRTGLSVSELGFGAASWWGQTRFNEILAARLVDEAIAQGVTFFDTGSSYSAGNAEPRLGRVLKGRHDLDRFVIATKAGTFAEGGRIGRDFSPSAVVATAERSLRNLGIDVLPLLQLHGPAANELTDDLRGALQGLKTRGVVRALGLNSFDPAVIEHAIALPEFDVVMVDYNVLRQDREPLIARAAAGKGVLAGMPLAMGHTGLQVAKLWSARGFWYAARGLLRHRREVAEGLKFRFLHHQRGMTGSQAALAFVLANPNVACAVFGTTRMRHLTENLAASGLALPSPLMARIRAA